MAEIVQRADDCCHFRRECMSGEIKDLDVFLDALVESIGLWPN